MMMIVDDDDHDDDDDDDAIVLIPNCAHFQVCSEMLKNLIH